ncbi:MAG: GMC family oxidoreductase [Chloroflexi bacterium]|nr:GMC family oxidoreductase [Chloroflexota bacterium]
MTSREVYDVLVIGSGAAGGAAAWRLANAGFKVVCLEQGRWMDPDRYVTRDADWEFRSMTDWHFDPNVRRRPEDYPVNDSESAVTPLMFNAVGGSTIHWTGHTPRFHPSDFRVRTLDGAGDDWPLTYEELEPYYDMNDVMMGCSGISGDPANPPRSQRPMRPLPLGPDGVRIAQAFDKLGWHWWPSDSYINSVPYDGRDACNNCGPNGLGCARRAKGSTDVTYWPKAIAKGAVLKTRCRVFEITVDQSGRCTGAAYYDQDGRIQREEARAVIVACNGVGTPRLLLVSRSSRHPEGLANSNGLVGKNLMYHPYAIVVGLIADIAEAWKGPLGNILMSQEFYETDPKRDFIRGYTFQMGRSPGPAGTAVSWHGNVVPWGARHHEEFATRFGHMVSLAVISEDLPDEKNRVTLDPKLTDSNGIPSPKVTYRVSENTRRLLDHGIGKARQVFEIAGAHTVMINPLLRSGGWHLMGTARLGGDPARSVLNRWGQAHDVNNLFVVDGSAFVTSAAVNPTPTIQALALRTADYIIREGRNFSG